MSALKNRSIVGIMGSHRESWPELAAPLGKWIAQQGYHLLTGSGTGTMAAVSEAFASVPQPRGVSIGIVPTFPNDDGSFRSKEGYPNPWVELPIYSPLPSYDGTPKTELSRNHINIMTSHVIVALPGSLGTRNEVELALRYKKPVILFGPKEIFAEFPKGVPRALDLKQVQDFISQQLKK